MVDVLLGLQWGDEGKGKIVDFFAPNYDVIARFQGGPNAGHTLYVEGKKVVLHQIPSGIFHPTAINVVGNGVVIDPVIFKKEIDALKALGVDVTTKLVISKRAHLILPTHRLIDAASEASKGKNKIGSTLKGIGPTYMDKTGRNGLRIGDIETNEFKEKYNTLVDKHKQLLSFYHYEYNLAELEPAWFEAIETLKQLQFIDTEHYINNAVINGKKVLAEGAQGSLLDVDFGSYPFVTSSNTICAGACNGLGIAPDAEVTDGKFSFVIIGDINLMDYFKHLGTVKKCKKINHPQVHYHQFEEINIESCDATKISIDMDGEFIGYAPMKLTNVSKDRKSVV